MTSGNQSDLGNQLTNLSTNLGCALVACRQTSAQSRIGSQMASSRITTLSSTDTTELGNVYDTDMAAATTSFSTEQAGYEAALQSTADIIQTSLLNFLSTTMIATPVNLADRLPPTRVREFETHQTSRFGEIQVLVDSIVDFPDGLIGVGGSRYALLRTDPESPFVWLPVAHRPRPCIAGHEPAQVLL